jgi:hypothetical protein
MENAERQIAFFKNIILSKDLASKYDLYVTDKRLVVIKTGPRPRYLGHWLAGTLIGQNWAEPIEKEKMKDLALDEMLRKDKKSFALAYDNIEKIQLLDPKSRWKDRTLDVKSGETQTKFILNKEQFEQLSTALPGIVALRGKIEI